MLIRTNRREWIAGAVAALTPIRDAGVETNLATGVKVGEVTPSGARIWARRTQRSLRRADGIAAAKGNRPEPGNPSLDPSTLEGSCPGAAGEMRVIVKKARGKAVYDSRWMEVTAESDFARQFEVTGLEPHTPYEFTVETRAGRGVAGHLSGSFRTAPAEDAVVSVEAAMLSCQKYSERDSADRGFLLYDAIRAWAPDFYLSVGDNVYYDSDDPIVTSPALARHHWARMYSLPSLVECLRSVPGYWSKDDHDCYSNDCYPGMVNPKMTPFTFEQGLKIFPEQAPMGSRIYRSFRWGRALEIWMLEGRDFRTENPAADGPGKSILGAEQKRWLQQSVAASKADWRIIVSPTPWVGPDRDNKKDNYANSAYRAEGLEMRRWLKENGGGNTLVVCGDRHWQYHSIDPATGAEEFGSGCASDTQASGTPGEKPEMHRFHRVKGGFLAIRVQPEGGGSRLLMEHRDVLGGRVYQRQYKRG